MSRPTYPIQLSYGHFFASKARPRHPWRISGPNVEDDETVFGSSDAIFDLLKEKNTDYCQRTGVEA